MFLTILYKTIYLKVKSMQCELLNKDTSYLPLDVDRVIQLSSGLGLVIKPKRKLFINDILTYNYFLDTIFMPRDSFWRYCLKYKHRGYCKILVYFFLQCIRCSIFLKYKKQTSNLYISCH